MADLLLMEDLQKIGLENYVEFSSTRSSGAGGQNVNKVNTKVELRFNIEACLVLNEEQKQSLCKKLANKINSEGQLILTSQIHRTQLANKKEVIEKLYHLLAKALSQPKKRKPTRRSAVSVEKRLEEKKARAELKKERKKKQNF